MLVVDDDILIGIPKFVRDSIHNRAIADKNRSFTSPDRSITLLFPRPPAQEKTEQERKRGKVYHKTRRTTFQPHLTSILVIGALNIIMRLFQACQIAPLLLYITRK